jgi:hypothetical protein
MEATRPSVTSGNEQMLYDMDPGYQAGYTQQEVDGKLLFRRVKSWTFQKSHMF